MEKMMSLYDYLGHAAGPELGRQVAKAASRAQIPIETRYVSNPRYKGDVILYPKQFLIEYFGGGSINEQKDQRQLLKG